MEKLKKILTKNAKWIAMFIIALLFAYIVNRIYKDNIYRFDNQIYKTIVIFMNPVVTKILKVLTHFGDWMIMIPISIGIIIKNRKCGILVSINLISIFILNQTLKLIFNRPRPEGNRLIEASGYSFPSGHSMVSMAFYGLLIYLAYKNIKNRMLKYIMCVLLTLLILVIGVSRIYLGVHYATDVVGGFLISLAYLIIFTHVIKQKEQL